MGTASSRCIIMDFDIKVDDKIFDQLLEVVARLAAPVDVVLTSGKCRYHNHA